MRRNGRKQKTVAVTKQQSWEQLQDLDNCLLNTHTTLKHCRICSPSSSSNHALICTTCISVPPFHQPAQGSNSPPLCRCAPLSRSRRLLAQPLQRRSRWLAVCWPYTSGSMCHFLPVRGHCSLWSCSCESKRVLVAVESKTRSIDQSCHHLAPDWSSRAWRTGGPCCSCDSN